MRWSVGFTVGSALFAGKFATKFFEQQVRLPARIEGSTV
jgi:hypothetical protein